MLKYQKHRSISNHPNFHKKTLKDATNVVAIRPNANDTKTPTSMSPTACGRRLQQRMIQMSLEIDDRKRNKELLREAIDKEEESGVTRQEEEEERLRQEFKAIVLSTKKANAALMEDCNRLVNKKKDLAAEIEGLVRTTEEAEDETVKEAQRFREQLRIKKEEARKTWEDGKLVRQEQWMDQKREEIRELTVQGLSPDVERIIRNHKVECARIESEGDMQKKNIMSDRQPRLEEMVRKAQMDVDQKLDEVGDNLRKEWNTHMSGMRNDHQRKLARLREQLSEEAIGHQRWKTQELRKMAEAHHENMEELRAAELKRIEQVQLKRIKDRERILHENDKKLEQLVLNKNAERNQWESKRLLELQSMSDQRVEKARQKLEAERDKAIDDIIRRIHTDECHMEKEMERRVKEETERIKAIQGVSMKKAHEQYQHSVESLAQATHELNSLEHKKSLSLADLQSTRKSITEAETSMAEMNNLKNERRGNASKEVKQIQANAAIELEHIASKRTSLEGILSSLRATQQAEARNHEALVKSMTSNHEQHLSRIEAKVKSDLSELEQKRVSMQESIQEHDIRIRHAQKMIKRYSKRNTG